MKSPWAFIGHRIKPKQLSLSGLTQSSQFHFLFISYTLCISCPGFLFPSKSTFYASFLLHVLFLTGILHLVFHFPLSDVCILQDTDQMSLVLESFPRSPPTPSQSLFFSCFICKNLSMSLSVSGWRVRIMAVHLCTAGDYCNVRHTGGGNEIYVCVHEILSDCIILKIYFDF